MCWLLLKRENQILKANNYIIENFSDHHLEDVIQIERLSNPTPWKEKTFKSVLSSRTLSFVIIKEKIIGFCIATKVFNECHLQNICVLPDYRKMGVGKNILEILNKRCKIHELKKIILEVRESNSGAQAFYTKSGFNKIGLRKDYYQLGNQREPAVLMSQILV